MDKRGEYKGVTEKNKPIVNLIRKIKGNYIQS